MAMIPFSVGALYDRCPDCFGHRPGRPIPSTVIDFFPLASGSVMLARESGLGVWARLAARELAKEFGQAAKWISGLKTATML